MSSETRGIHNLSPSLELPVRLVEPGWGEMERYFKKAEQGRKVTKPTNIWRCDSCPYCGHTHEHGAGFFDDNPLSFLGHRASHCIGDERTKHGGYYLVWDRWSHKEKISEKDENLAPGSNYQKHKGNCWRVKCETCHGLFNYYGRNGVPKKCVRCEASKQVNNQEVSRMSHNGEQKNIIFKRENLVLVDREYKTLQVNSPYTGEGIMLYVTDAAGLEQRARGMKMHGARLYGEHLLPHPFKTQGAPVLLYCLNSSWDNMVVEPDYNNTRRSGIIGLRKTGNNKCSVHINNQTFFNHYEAGTVFDGQYDQRENWITFWKRAK